MSPAEAEDDGASGIHCRLDELLAEGLPVLDVRLQHSIRVRESHEAARPLIHFDPRHKLTQAFTSLYQQLAAAPAGR